MTDRVADWLIEELDARAQLRFGVWLSFASVPVFFYAPWSGEPLIIYLMSALALTLGGINFVIGAEVLEQGESNGDGHCEGCTCADR